MDQLARQHIANRLASARKRRAFALRDIGMFLKQAEEGYEGDWHNLATTVAMGAAAKGEIQAYRVALEVEDGSDDRPAPPTSPKE
jgi:hypothetical protein